MRLVALLVFSFACSVDPDDGQFLCSDGRCPSGQTCVDGVCRDEPGGDVDSGVDGGLVDATLDAPDGEAPDGDAPDADAGAGSEVCTPSSVAGTSAADEDGDGAIDEGCPWHFGAPHPVLDLDRGVEEHWSPVVVDDPRRLYFAYSGADGSGVYLAQRASAADRFAIELEPERVFDPLDDRPIYTFAITPDERVLVVQVGGELVIAERGSPDVAFAESRSLGLGIHPTIRADGLELVFVRDNRLLRIVRAGRGAEFGGGSIAVTESPSDVPSYPRMTPDGRTLVYGSGPSLVLATRNETDALFGDVTGLPGVSGHSLSVSFATREVYFSVPSSDFSPGAQGVWRMELCRDGACPSRALTCPPALEPVRQLGCYARGGMHSTLGAATSFCTTAGGTLASINSVGEREELTTAGLVSATDSAWTGAVTESLADGRVAYTWPTDEPFVGYRGLWRTLPAEGDLASRCAAVDAGGLVARRCDGGATIPALCERVHWPVW